MFVVYEVFKSDGKRFPVYHHHYWHDCYVWAFNHNFDWKSVVEGRAKFVIVKEDWS